MEYNWDKDKIEKLKKEYMDLKINTKGLLEEDLKDIDENLWIIEEMKNIYNNVENKFQIEDKPEILLQEIYECFKNIPNFIQKWILNSISIFQKSKNLSVHEIPKLNLTNEELISLSHDFFNWLPNKKYVHLVDKYLSKEEGILYLRDSTINYYMGSTFLFHYPSYQPFFLIERENTIEDFETLNHEIAHGIYMFSDTNIPCNNNSNYLFELEGYHFNFLSRMFLKEKNIVPPKTLEIMECWDFFPALESTISFYLQSLAIPYYINPSEFKIEMLLEKKFPCTINEENIFEYLQNTPQNAATYALSFLTSLDLENIYVQDRELAFHKFESIRYNKTNDLERNLTDHGITFMQDGYQNLRKRVRKLNHFQN